MTRPFGRSPARAKPLRPSAKLEEVSLIDVVAEDDNLLPVKGGAPKGSFTSGSLSRPGPSPFKTSACRPLESIQEDQPELGVLDEEEQQEDLPPPLSLQGPTPGKRKKKSGFNLRKSLAWNNAFFTEEGVLDPEELALVNGTFKKTPEAPKPGSHKKPALASKLLNSTGIPKIKFSPVRSHKTVTQVDSKQVVATVRSPLRSTGTVSKQSEIGKGPSTCRSIVPSKVQLDPVKGARSMFSMRTEAQERKKSSLLSKQKPDATSSKANVSPQPVNTIKTVAETRNIHTLTNTFSFASKKMKDKLGMVFSGLGMGNSKPDTLSMPKDDTAVPSPTAMSKDYAENAKLTRCYSQLSSYGKFRRAISPNTDNNPSIVHAHQSAANVAMESSLRDVESSVNQEKHSADSSASCCQNQAVLAVTDSSSRFATKETTSQSLLTRAKPSGLRMPSPKLGFFDKARPSSTAQTVNNGIKYGESAGYVSKCVDMHSITAKQTGTALQAGRCTSTASNRSLSENSTLGAHAKQSSAKPPLYATVKSDQQHSDIAGRNKGVQECSVTPYQTLVTASMHGAVSAALTNPSPAVLACGTSVRNEASHVSQCSTFLINQDTSTHGLSLNAVAKSKSCHAGKSESVGTGNILQAKKNSLNVPATVKKGITALSLPAKSATGQENARSECAQEQEPSKAPGDSKNIRNLETEVWPEVKSGAVQHSPPNKEPPKPGPWSPVRRNGQELGPFDCTKYTNLGVTQH